MNYKITIRGFKTNDLINQRELVKNLIKDLDLEISSIDLIRQLREGKNVLNVETCFETVSKGIINNFDCHYSSYDPIQEIEMEEAKKMWNNKISNAEIWYKSLNDLHKSYVETLIKNNQVGPAGSGPNYPVL